ncbi:MAG: HINT domain-containing protein [Planctomycetaceae bacterium]|jgi:hypothetical protein|nr:HINT domain-containing protein [Planctomycetaceae bacterium]
MSKQHNSNKSTNLTNTPFYHNPIVVIGFMVCILSLGILWDYAIAPRIFQSSKTVQVTKTWSTDSSVKFAKIQDVQVGERAIGKNPELTDSERATFFPDPKPTTWRKLTLEMIKSDGKRLDITLLRPLNWISESQADIGTTIFLDLPELGAQGFAKVLNIESCPPIKSGKGNVITGTFHHEAANTIDLHVEGLSKPIGCTDNHPFWSVTRNEFVEARKLQQGEELQLYNGQTAKVIQILPRPGPKQVHNLEVMNEHVYRVSDQGILVHNNYVYQNTNIKRQKQNEHVFGTPEYNNRLKNPPASGPKPISVFLDAAAEHYVTETMKHATGIPGNNGIIYEYDFGKIVGLDGDGGATTRVRVIEDSHGQIHGFPY